MQQICSKNKLTLGKTKLYTNTHSSGYFPVKHISLDCSDNLLSVHESWYAMKWKKKKLKLLSVILSQIEL